MRDRHLSQKSLDQMLPRGWSLVGLGSPCNRRKLLWQAQSIARRDGADAARAWCAERVAEGLDALGHSSESIALDDLRPPPEKPALVAQTTDRVREVQDQYAEGLITDGERYNKTVDLWAGLRERVRWASDRAQREAPTALDGWCAREAVPNTLVSLRAMVGLRAKPSGEIIEAPVLASLAEGLGPHGFFLVAGGDRRARTDAMAREPALRALRDTLLWALDRWRITEVDCGSTEGTVLSAAPEDDGHVVLRGRLLGRFLCDDLMSAAGDPLGVRGDLIDEARAAKIIAERSPRVSVRWALGCVAEKGLCAQCFGCGSLVQPLSVGAPVGVRAAHAIAHHARNLRPRPYSICGGTILRPQSGGVAVAHARCRVRWSDIDAVFREGSWLVLNHLGGLQLFDAQGSEIDVTMTAQGDRLHVEDGRWVEAGTEIRTQVPWNRPLLAVIPEGQTAVVRERFSPSSVVAWVDGVTGLARRTVVERDGVTLELVGLGDGPPHAVWIPEKSVLTVVDGSVVRRGDLLATRDLFAGRASNERSEEGLDGLAKLLNGRITWRRARLAPTRGWCVVASAPGRASTVEIRPTPGVSARPLRISARAHLSVFHGSFVEVGDRLTSGTRSHRDLLRVWGRARLAAHLMDELVDLFGGAGEAPESADLELVLCAMLSRVRVFDPGDTALPRAIVSRRRYLRERAKAAREGGRAPRAVELLTGIAACAGRGFLRGF